jgi:hypothetical protein
MLMKTFLAYVNIDKIHGKPKIVLTSHKFIKMVLVASIDPLLATILTIKILYYFPTHLKGANIMIFLIFTFWKNNSPIFTILASFMNSNGVLGS